eukprot:3467821-Rhodomonas_salina.1
MSGSDLQYGMQYLVLTWRAVLAGPVEKSGEGAETGEPTHTWGVRSSLLVARTAQKSHLSPRVCSLSTRVCSVSASTHLQSQHTSVPGCVCVFDFSACACTCSCTCGAERGSAGSRGLMDMLGGLLSPHRP